MKKEETIVGLDISTDLIKAVELRRVREGIQVHAFGQIDTPPGSLREGVIANPPAVAKAVSTLLSKNGIRSKSVIVSVRSPYALLRMTRVPFMSKEQAYIAINKEIKQYTVFKNRPSLHDIHIVEEISEEGLRKMNVLFAVTPQVLSDTYMRTLSEIGLDVVGMDVSTLAMVRSMNMTNLKATDMRVAMLVAINPESLDMCILKGNSMRFCHTIKIDMSQIVKDIDGFTEKVGTAFTLVLNFYQAKYAGGEPVSKVVLSCDSYSCVALKDKLSQRLRDVIIDIGDPAGYMTFDQHKISPEKIGQLRSYTCALGNALQGGTFSDYPVRFNLLPAGEVAKVERSKLLRYVTIGVGGIMILFLIAAGYLFFVNKNYEFHIAHAKKQLTVSDPNVAKVNTMLKNRNRLIEALDAKMGFLSTLDAKTVVWDRVFTGALAYVPEDLWVTSISGTERHVIINGAAFSEEPIFKLVSDLDSSYYFSSTKLISSNNISYKDQDAVQFSISCELK